MNGELELERFDEALLCGVRGFDGIRVRPTGGIVAVYVDGRLDRISYRTPDGGVALAPAHTVTLLTRDPEPEVKK